MRGYTSHTVHTFNWGFVNYFMSKYTNTFIQLSSLWCFYIYNVFTYSYYIIYMLLCFRLDTSTMLSCLYAMFVVVVGTSLSLAEVLMDTMSVATFEASLASFHHKIL